MEEILKISDAEWEIIKIVWGRPQITSNEIIHILQDKTDWKAATIKTLINRLLNKGAINYKKDNKQYLYYAVIDEEKYKAAETKLYLAKVFDGSIIEMLNNYLQEDCMKAGEKEELIKLADLIKREKFIQNM